ncbi:ap2a1-1 [Symbiodinium natans]|uniref:Ap2a1-1 protein n=1 Tax=Symbiodinium natans TaxID=878477 RepID=A0A812RU79_9DINO|nr:ap2a1-1 [Symbiodinium natans]
MGPSKVEDPSSELRRGEFGRYAANASISIDGGPLAGAESPGELPPLPAPTTSLAAEPPPAAFPAEPFPAAPAFPVEPTPVTSQDRQIGPPAGLDPTGRENLSNGELLERIAQLERQITRAAVGGPTFGAAPPAQVQDFPLSLPNTGHGLVDFEALEARSAHVTQRLEAAEQELRAEKEAGRGNKLKVEQLEQKLKDREQLLSHAKEMWMKENVRASKLADALTAAEDKLADQERRLADVSAKYAEAQQEVRQLQHLLGSSTGGLTGYAPGAVAGDAGLGFDLPASDGRNGYAKARIPSTGMTQVPWSDDLGMVPTDESLRMGSPPRTLASSGQMPLLENDTNAERFRRLCLLNDAVLYEDDLLQVGIKAEYSGLEGQIAVFFGNKGHAALHTFTAQYFVREEQALRLVASPMSQQLEADEQVVQRVTVSLREPFAEPPWLRLQFLLPDASPRRIQLKFPIILPKFMVGRDLSPQEFFHHWRLQHFVLNEVTSIVHLSERLRGPLVNIARCIVFGGAFRLHHGIDSNADNFVLVSTLSDPAVAARMDARGLDPLAAPDREGGLSLMRVEVGSGRFTGKARVPRART